MAIPVVQYKGFELRSYSSQIFPTHHDPYASGVKRFTSIVRIDTIPFCEASAKRYATVRAGVDPASSADALDLAMQYGKDIVDSKIHSKPL